MPKGIKRQVDDIDLRELDTASSYEPEEIVVSDLALIDAARNGDNAAFASLYRRHYGAMLAFAWQYSRSKEQAEDLASEAFASILDAIRRGKGPNAAVRAYMLTTVRNAAMKGSAQQASNILVGEFEHLDIAVETTDPVESSFENAVIARSFARLPERWQQVIWYLDVEQATPAVAGAILGMRPNAVSALAKRARTGLRKAYSQEHAATVADVDCRPFASRLAEFAQGGLGRTQRREVDEHLTGCATCRAAYAEIIDLQRRIGLSVPLGIAAAGASALITTIVVKDLAMPTATWAAALSAGGGAAGSAGAGGAGGTVAGSAGSSAGSSATVLGIVAVGTVFVGGIAAAVGISIARSHSGPIAGGTRPPQVQTSVAPPQAPADTLDTPSQTELIAPSVPGPLPFVNDPILTTEPLESPVVSPQDTTTIPEAGPIVPLPSAGSPTAMPADPESSASPTPSEDLPSTPESDPNGSAEPDTPSDSTSPSPTDTPQPSPSVTPDTWSVADGLYGAALEIEPIPGANTDQPTYLALHFESNNAKNMAGIKQFVDMMPSDYYDQLSKLGVTTNLSACTLSVSDQDVVTYRCQWDNPSKSAIIDLEPLPLEVKISMRILNITDIAFKGAEVSY